MAHGLQIWNASGVLQFDSSLAAGGVSLGFFAIPLVGAILTFPTMVGRTGFLTSAGSGGPVTYTTDSVSGYLRFVFPAADSGRFVSLFAK
jgi:hypothetical protein